MLPCDVTDEPSVESVFAALAKEWSNIDFLVHAVAFSDKEQLDGRYVDTTQDNFTQTLLISCYSFTALARRAEKLMPNGGSLLTLTYYGAEKVMPHYNVMGVAKAALEASVRYLAADLGKGTIRVNAISAGPIKTLAASGIADFRYILKWNEYNSPLRRTVSIEDVGAGALYLLSDLGRGVTGEILHIDAGYHVVGMKNEDAPRHFGGEKYNRPRCPRLSPLPSGRGLFAPASVPLIPDLRFALNSYSPRPLEGRIMRRSRGGTRCGACGSCRNKVLGRWRSSPPDH